LPRYYEKRFRDPRCTPVLKLQLLFIHEKFQDKHALADMIVGIWADCGIRVTKEKALEQARDETEKAMVQFASFWMDEDFDENGPGGSWCIDSDDDRED
jgi:hypothetical protein